MQFRDAHEWHVVGEAERAGEQDLRGDAQRGKEGGSAPAAAASPPRASSIHSVRTPSGEKDKGLN